MSEASASASAPVNGSAAAANAGAQGPSSPLTDGRSATSPESPAPATAAASPDPHAPLEPAWLEGVAVPVGNEEEFSVYGQALRADGVGADAGRAVLSWLAELRAMPEDQHPKLVSVKHAYQYERSHYDAEDEPYLQSFLNHMHAKGASQADVDAALRMYAKVDQHMARQEVAAGRDLEVYDREDKAAAEEWVREKYGDTEAPAIFRLLKHHLQGMSQEQRNMLAVRDEEGRKHLFDPKVLERLIARVRGGSETKEEIERIMREDRARYDRDERLQARLRDFYRGNASPASSVDAVEKEIAEIEALMRINPTAYFRDEAKQARLRTLYRARR